VFIGNQRIGIFACFDSELFPKLTKLLTPWSRPFFRS